MKKLFLMVGSILAASALTPAEARAQDRFGGEGQFAIAAERVTGVVSASQTTEVGGEETTSSFTSINLLTSPLSGFTTNYSFPRVGFDYFATDGFSLGMALGYFTFSGSVE